MTIYIYFSKLVFLCSMIKYLPIDENIKPLNSKVMEVWTPLRRLVFSWPEMIRLLKELFTGWPGTHVLGVFSHPHFTL